MFIGAAPFMLPGRFFSHGPLAAAVSHDDPDGNEYADANRD
jgi:hypothetical protein